VCKVEWLLRQPFHYAFNKNVYWMAVSYSHESSRWFNDGNFRTPVRSP
jgi:hypothetical protein